MQIFLVSGKEYRCISLATNKFGGAWDFNYKGKWLPVKNYNIKIKLNKIYDISRNR